jgi:hypothetical protein
VARELTLVQISHRGGDLFDAERGVNQQMACSSNSTTMQVGKKAASGLLFEQPRGMPWRYVRSMSHCPPIQMWICVPRIDALDHPGYPWIASRRME